MLQSVSLIFFLLQCRFILTAEAAITPRTFAPNILQDDEVLRICSRMVQSAIPVPKYYAQETTVPLGRDDFCLNFLNFTSALDSIEIFKDHFHLRDGDSCLLTEFCKTWLPSLLLMFPNWRLGPLNGLEIMGLALLHQFFTNPVGISEDVFNQIFVFELEDFEYAYTDLAPAEQHSNMELKAQMFLHRISSVFLDLEFCCCLEVLREAFGSHLFFKYVPIADMLVSRKHPYWDRLLKLPPEELIYFAESAILYRRQGILEALVNFFPLNSATTLNGVTFLEALVAADQFVVSVIVSACKSSSKDQDLDQILKFCFEYQSFEFAIELIIKCFWNSIFISKDEMLLLRQFFKFTHGYSTELQFQAFNSFKRLPWILLSLNCSHYFTLQTLHLFIRAGFFAAFNSKFLSSPAIFPAFQSYLTKTY